MTGARLVLLGDDKQTGAIEQGKPFWLMQRFGLATAQLTESLRQQTKSTKAAVTHAYAAEYAASLSQLDKMVSGEGALCMILRPIRSPWDRRVHRTAGQPLGRTDALSLPNRRREHALGLDLLA
jgi:hypothetical protein